METMDIRGFKFPGKRSGLRGDLGEVGELEVFEPGLSPESRGKVKPPKAAEAVVEFIGSCVISGPWLVETFRDEVRKMPRRRCAG